MPLLEHIRPELAAQIRGTTDSEYIYALFLSQLGDWRSEPDVDEIIAALSATLRILTAVRSALKARTRSSLNLVICDENLFVGARLTLDFGRFTLDAPSEDDVRSPFLGLWFTGGGAFEKGPRGWRMSGGAARDRAVLLSSEPLTRDTTGWVEVPEYNALAAVRHGDRVDLSLHEVPF
jgi:predicted glutamine amidotransferase